MEFTLQAPQTLDEMLQISETLASNFMYVRVDLYSMNIMLPFS